MGWPESENRSGPSDLISYRTRRPASSRSRVPVASNPVKPLPQVLDFKPALGHSGLNTRAARDGEHPTPPHSSGAHEPWSMGANYQPMVTSTRGTECSARNAVAPWLWPVGPVAAEPLLRFRFGSPNGHHVLDFVGTEFVMRPKCPVGNRTFRVSNCS